MHSGTLNAVQPMEFAPPPGNPTSIWLFALCARRATQQPDKYCPGQWSVVDD
jgi:hypothetical protein